MIKDSLVILVITAVMILGLEFALRVVFPDRVPKVKDPAFQQDAELIIRLKANKTKTFKNEKVNGGEVITWQTNSHAFRGEELRESAAYRVIVYGDSNVQARFSSRENTFPARLEHYLSSAKPGVEVINAGMVGAGTDQQLMRFIRDAEEIKPDLAIVHIFADNDFGDLVRNQLYSVDEQGELVELGRPVMRDVQLPAVGLVASAMERSMIVKLVKGFASPASGDGNKDDVQALIQNLVDTSNREYEAYVSGSARPSHFADHYDIDLATAPDSDAAKLKVKLMQAVMKEFTRQAGQRQIDVMFVVQPSVYDLATERNEYRKLVRGDLQSVGSYHYTNLTQPLKQACTQHGMNCVHLIDTYVEHEVESLYRKRDNHWNDRGQDVAARITSDAITRLD